MYTVTTALDPRFGLTYTADDEQCIKAKSDVLGAALTSATLLHGDHAGDGNSDRDVCTPTRKKDKLDAGLDFGRHGTTCTHNISRGSRPMSHLSLMRSKLSWPSTWLHHVNQQRQIHSRGGVTTRPGFLFSVMPLDVTWRPLQRACLVSVSSAPLVTLLMTSEHVYWLKISNAWFFLKQT